MKKEFQTLRQEVTVSGVGLHSGQNVTLRLLPDSRPGWRFVRRDLSGAPEIGADLENVAATQHATVLQNGAATVSTTEHLLAALWAMGVSHASIELDGPEVPILDGSAQGWVEAIETVGLRPLPGARPVFGLTQPIWWEGGGASVLGLPHPEFRLSVAVDFNHLHAGAQTIDLTVDGANFAQELAAARTFTLESWLEPLRTAGLIRGGSLDNAILVSESGLSSPPRFSNEMVRHKALDAIGDLALLFGGNGGVFQGHLIAVRAGHGPHRAWMESCRNQGALQPV
jgi:UDP-3-O-[3-hydroxymyristoyl] N-acetylglucosamine deacetylase